MDKVVELDFRKFLEHSNGELAGLPLVTKTSTVKFVERNKNPIFVLLSDGTKLYFTWDEFKRINGCEPTPGKQMTVVFQRNMKDGSGNPSQIDSIICR